MKNVREIIGLFGGARPLAKLLGCPATTPQNWINREYIPYPQQVRILEAAAREGIYLTPDDFFKGVKMPKRK